MIARTTLIYLSYLQFYGHVDLLKKYPWITIDLNNQGLYKKTSDTANNGRASTQLFAPGNVRMLDSENNSCSKNNLIRRRNKKK